MCDNDEVSHRCFTLKETPKQSLNTSIWRELIREKVNKLKENISWKFLQRISRWGRMYGLLVLDRCRKMRFSFCNLYINWFWFMKELWTLKMMYIRSTCGKAHVGSPFVSYTHIQDHFFLLRDLELHAHWWPHRYHCIYHHQIGKSQNYLSSLSSWCSSESRWTKHVVVEEVENF